MGEHRNDLCQLAQSLVDIAIGQIPHFKLTRYRIPPLPPLRVARRMLVRRLSGLVGKCSAQNQQMLWATTVFVDCRDAPLAAEHAVVHAIFVDAARSMPMSSQPCIPKRLSKSRSTGRRTTCGLSAGRSSPAPMTKQRSRLPSNGRKSTR